MKIHFSNINLNNIAKNAKMIYDNPMSGSVHLNSVWLETILKLCEQAKIMETITAEKARKIAQKNNPSMTLNEVMPLIETAASNGSNHVNIFRPLSDETITELIKLGYQLPPVGRIAEIHHMFHTIHWG
jgi:hypothetical protein